MKISTKSILILISGFAFALLVGAVVFILLFFIHAKNYGIMLAPEVYTDKKARESFRDGNRGLPDLPPTANKLLFIQGGGCDPIYYMAFSAAKEDCNKYISDFSREHGSLTRKDFFCSLKKDSNFPSVSYSLKWDGFTPHLYGKYDEQWPRDYWKINDVKEGSYFEDQFLFLLYDTENLRIYIITYTI